MANYVITFDENGQPIISHAFWNRQNQNGTKKDHKYYEKIKNGLKARYFYSKQEWDAFQRNRSTAPSTRSTTPSTSSISEGKGTDKGRTGTNASPVTRPAGHRRRTGSGEAKSVYRRGEGLGSSTPATGGTGNVPKMKKEQIRAEFQKHKDFKSISADAKSVHDVGEKIKKKAEDISGLTKRKEAKAANEEAFKAALNYVTKDLNKDGKIKNIQRERETYADKFDANNRSAERAKTIIEDPERRSDPNNFHEQQIQMAMVDEILNDVAKSKKEMEAAQARADQILKEYKKTPIGAIEYAVESTGDFLDKYFNKKK